MMLGLMKEHLWGAAICGILCFAMISCGASGGVSGDKSAMTLEALYTAFGIPSSCETAAAWEGKQVVINGYVDLDNIFDKQHFPNLPYEKFRLIDRKGRSIEVWVKSPDSRTIFSRVYRKKNAHITISGRLTAVKMPIMGKCRLGAKVWIDDPSQVQ
jgi:hypothetical protein